MKVTVKQVNSYEITIGGRTFSGFVKDGEEWEGMVKFKGPAGTIIVEESRGSPTVQERF